MSEIYELGTPEEIRRAVEACKKAGLIESPEERLTSVLSPTAKEQRKERVKKDKPRKYSERVVKVDQEKYNMLKMWMHSNKGPQRTAGEIKAELPFVMSSAQIGTYLRMMSVNREGIAINSIRARSYYSAINVG